MPKKSDSKLDKKTLAIAGGLGTVAGLVVSMPEAILASMELFGPETYPLIEPYVEVSILYVAPTVMISGVAIALRSVYRHQIQDYRLRRRATRFSNYYQASAHTKFPHYCTTLFEQVILLNLLDSDEALRTFARKIDQSERDTKSLLENTDIIPSDEIVAKIEQAAMLPDGFFKGETESYSKSKLIERLRWHARYNGVKAHTLSGRNLSGMTQQQLVSVHRDIEMMIRARREGGAAS